MTGSNDVLGGVFVAQTELYLKASRYRAKMVLVHMPVIDAPTQSHLKLNLAHGLHLFMEV